MCGRYTLTGTNPTLLRERFGLAADLEVRPRWNIAPGQDVLAVTGGEDGAPGGELLRWGLIPHWASDPKIAHRLINARGETVAEKPSFRESFARRRCLIPADGFYEWQQRGGGPKQPWWITREDHAPFAFAGLWASWRPAEDVEPVRTCTVITTEAIPSLREVHARMPVILRPEDEGAWLAAETPREALQAMLEPFGPMARVPVGRGVNDVRHDGPELIVPVESGEGPAGGATLF